MHACMYVCMYVFIIQLLLSGGNIQSKQRGVKEPPLVVHQELDVQELGQLRCALLKDVLAVDLAIPRAPLTKIEGHQPSEM